MHEQHDTMLVSVDGIFWLTMRQNSLLFEVCNDDTLRKNIMEKLFEAIRSSAICHLQ